MTYDLLTRTGYTIDDIGDRLTWSVLLSFIRNLDTDSAVGRELGKYTGWETTNQTNILLADMYDLLQAINGHITQLGGSKRKKIIPYPRPGKETEDKQHIGGKGSALPYTDFMQWYEDKRNGRRQL